MDITWHGNSCFRIKGKKTTLVINPNKDAGELEGDIVLTSLGEDTAEVSGAYKIFDWPGEYEARRIPINAYQAWKTSKSKEADEAEGGSVEEETIIFRFSMGKVKFCHLGELGHTLTSDMINKIGDVDVLMMDVSKGSNLTPKKALELIEAVEPKCVIFMGPEGESEILKEIGAENVEQQNKFTVKSPADLPVDKRLFVALKKT